MIAVVTLADDLHALAVRTELARLGERDVHLVEVDRLAQRPSLTYGIGTPVADRVRTAADVEVSLRQAEVVWVRRLGAEQRLDPPLEDAARAVAVGDCRGGLAGYLSTHAPARWVSSPEATLRASDKLHQLAAAHRSGFRVPRTLVTQSKEEVLAFFDRCDGAIIVKTIVGAAGPFLETVRIDDPAVIDEATYAVSPAIYQELIPGTDHLRLVCLGDRSHAALLRSEALDWRAHLGIPMEAWPVPDDLHRAVRAVLDRLELAMGVIDLKLTPQGEPVWLEVNPQGQFLFLDALTSLHLARRVAEYLLEEQQAARCA